MEDKVQCAPQANPLGACADSRGRASGHCRTVLSLSFAVLLSNARCRQNVPSGIVNTIAPVRCVSRACAIAFCSMGPITLRPPMNTAAVINIRKSDSTTTSRAVFARSSSRRERDDRGTTFRRRL